MPVSPRECAGVELIQSAGGAGAGPVVCWDLEVLGCLGHGCVSIGLRRLKLHGIKRRKEPFFGLQKIKQFVEHQGNAYVRNFGLFLVLMGPKNVFFGAMDCLLRQASRKEQSIAPPKSDNDGRIEESSRRLHWSDITGTLDLITLYNVFTRADIQCSKQALQI